MPCQSRAGGTAVISWDRMRPDQQMTFSGMPAWPAKSRTSVEVDVVVMPTTFGSAGTAA